MFTLTTPKGTYTATDRATLENQMKGGFNYSAALMIFGSAAQKREAKVALQHAKTILAALNKLDGLDTLTDDDLLAELA